MAKKSTPLPPEVSDKVVWFLYESHLKKFIQEIPDSEKYPETNPNPPNKNARARDGDKIPKLFEISDSEVSTSDDDSSDSDLESYSVSRPFPHKHFKPDPERER